MPPPRYDRPMRLRPQVAVVVLVATATLVVPVPSAPLRRTSISTVAEGGCPDGYEPYGVLIEKSGAAYLVCRDKQGGGLIYVPLAARKERMRDA